MLEAPVQAAAHFLTSLTEGQVPSSLVSSEGLLIPTVSELFLLLDLLNYNWKVTLCKFKEQPVDLCVHV